jgi:hypothetical protein
LLMRYALGYASHNANACCGCDWQGDAQTHNYAEHHIEMIVDVFSVLFVRIRRL